MNKHDLIRARKLQRKLDRTVTENSPTTSAKPWFKYARCPLCLERYVVNNNARREIRAKRILGVAICANCFYKRGTERLVRIHKLGKELAQVTEVEELFDDVKYLEHLIQTAKELVK